MLSLQQRQQLNHLGIGQAQVEAQAYAGFTCKQRSSAWLALRKGRVTASAFAAAAGEDPYLSPAQLLARILEDAAPAPTPSMQFGVDNEAAGAARYLEVLRLDEQLSGSTFNLQKVGQRCTESQNSRRRSCALPAQSVAAPFA